MGRALFQDARQLPDVARVGRLRELFERGRQKSAAEIFVRPHGDHGPQAPMGGVHRSRLWQVSHPFACRSQLIDTSTAAGEKAE